jgi:hypothetical protein
LSGRPSFPDFLEVSQPPEPRFKTESHCLDDVQDVLDLGQPLFVSPGPAEIPSISRQRLHLHLLVNALRTKKANSLEVGWRKHHAFILLLVAKVHRSLD